jgi:serine/threonine-protein kinase
MPAPHLIHPPIGSSSPSSRDTQGRPRSLPPDLLREASQRLGILSLLGAVLWFLGTVLGHITYAVQSPAGDTRWRSLMMPIDAIAATSIVVSLALFAYTRRYKGSKMSLDLGLAYMIALAFGLGLMFHVGAVYYGADTLGDRRITPEISWVGALILMFAAIVPTPPRKTIIAALVAASMNPLGMLFVRAHGGWDFGAPGNVLLMHYPDFLLVGVAGVISHVVTQLGRQITRARELGSYRIGELLGRGGMGEVYKATHTMLARPAAIKLIRPEALGAGNSEAAQLALRRFTREAEAAASLRSPHTVEVYDFGVTEDQTLYFVMEMLEGMDLESLVSQNGPLPAGRVIYVVRQACASLEEAHARGLVHRDIKPANIHVGRVGLQHDFVKVLDFGLVKEVERPVQDTLVTAEGVTMGTPSYMAPELALGEPVDGRADIYALGCVAYFLLTGRMVFEADNPMRLMVKHIEAKPVAPSQRTELPIPPSLDEAVLGCLAKDPAARTPSAAAFAAALASAAVDAEPWGEAQAAAWWGARDGVVATETSAAASPIPLHNAF